MVSDFCVCMSFVYVCEYVCFTYAFSFFFAYFLRRERESMELSVLEGGVDLWGDAGGEVWSEYIAWKNYFQ